MRRRKMSDYSITSPGVSNQPGAGRPLSHETLGCRESDAAPGIADDIGPRDVGVLIARYIPHRHKSYAYVRTPIPSGRTRTQASRSRARLQIGL